MSEKRVLGAGGTKIASAAMRVPKALQFAAYLRKKGVETGTQLIETRRRQDSAEVVVFDVDGHAGATVEGLEKAELGSR